MITNSDGSFICLTDEWINKYLKELEIKLLGRRPYAISLDLAWLNQFPDEPGIYILLEREKILYIGETNSIKKCFRRWLDIKSR